MKNLKSEVLNVQEMNVIEMEELNGGSFWGFVTEKVLPVVEAILIGGGAANGNVVVMPIFM